MAKKNNSGQSVLNTLSLIGIAAFCIKYYFLGKITLEFAVGLMIVAVILAALNHTVATVIKLGFTILGLGFFLADYFYSVGSFIQILSHLLVLLIALFGIYIIVKKTFGSKDKDE